MAFDEPPGASSKPTWLITVEARTRREAHAHTHAGGAAGAREPSRRRVGAACARMAPRDARAARVQRRMRRACAAAVRCSAAAQRARAPVALNPAATDAASRSAAQSDDILGLLSKMMGAMTQLGLDVYRRVLTAAQRAQAHNACGTCAHTLAHTVVGSALTRCARVSYDSAEIRTSAGSASMKFSVSRREGASAQAISVRAAAALLCARCGAGAADVTRMLT